jgi:hypothetical protein
VKRTMVALAVIALVSALVGPAAAKGAIPESAQMTGPGLDKPITFGSGLRSSPPNGGVSILATDTKLFDTLFDGNLVSPRGGAKLGPRYTITWRMRQEFQPGHKTFDLRSDLYPYAPGGPLVHTFGGQKVNDGGGGFVLQGGWAAANPVLIDNLRAWGLPKNPSSSTGTAPSSAIAPWWAIVLGFAVLIAAGIASVRRRAATLEAV